MKNYFFLHLAQKVTLNKGNNKPGKMQLYLALKHEPTCILTFKTSSKIHHLSITRQ